MEDESIYEASGLRGKLGAVAVNGGENGEVALNGAVIETILVAAVFLGSVEGLIRPVEKGLIVRTVLRSQGHSQTQGNGAISVGAGKGGEDPLDQGFHLVNGIGHKDEELVPAYPGGHIVAADAPQDLMGHGLQNIVAKQVAEAVVG